MAHRMETQTPAREEGIATADRPRTRTPRCYIVLLHNDDFTTMEFVVEILTRYFRKDVTEANRIMLEVHYKGTGVAGRFTREVAESKIAQVTNLAREREFPLLLTMEPE